MTRTGRGTTADEATALGSLHTQLYIEGRWSDASSGATFVVEDPATGAGLASVADAGPDDALGAVEAAAAANEQWGRSRPRARSELLYEAYRELISGGEELALLIALETGKPIAEARAEVAYGAEFIRWYAEEAVRFPGGARRDPTGDSEHIVLNEPVGACLLITPWNFPLAMVTRKVAPALAAGCTTILKPAEQTPLTALWVADVFHRLGAPPGVLNVIPTSGAEEAVAAAIDHPALRKLSFTGSTEVGKILLRRAASQVLRTSMELGGNAPFIVFADADLDAAVSGALLAKFRNGGQSCVAANRFLVDESVADEFAERLRKAITELRLGRGTEPSTDIGPMIDSRHADKVEELIGVAVRHGADVIVGGSRDNNFIQPTLLRVAQDSPILQREVFGPVAPVQTFRGEAAAIREANRTSAGLVAFAYTKDLDRAQRVIRSLQAGMVGVNQGVVSNAAAPFGGIKSSGLGREGAESGLLEYLESKYIAVATDESALAE